MFSDECRLLGTIGLPVRDAVPITRDRAVRSVSNRDVDRSGRRGLFGKARERLGAGEAIAARHPVAGLLLAEDDRIESTAVERLEADDAAASLIEGIEPDPGF